MSVSESAVFAYESSVHSTHVLLGLNEQRQKDVLCDLTVLVQGRRFRAHRAVLAACSSYFHARVVGHAEAELSITLPEEVTVKGFEPLIQFAYTAKLVLSGDNVEEVCRCVALLRVHDVEESCFQFLRFKFMDSAASASASAASAAAAASAPAAPRPPSPPSPGCAPHDPKDLAADDGQELPETKSAQTPPCALQRCPGSAEDGAGHAFESPGPDKDAAAAPGLPSLCPKYRKFQRAFGTDRGRVVEAGGVRDAPGAGQPNELPENGCPWAAAPDGPDPTPAAEPAHAQGAALPCGGPAEGAPGLFALSLLHPPYDPPCDSNFAGPQGPAVKAEAAGAGPDRDPQEPYPEPDLGAPQDEGGLAPGDRSSVEREVAEHLAKGFWSDVCPPEPPGHTRPSPAPAGEGPEPSHAQKRPECPWLGIRISESPEPGPRTFATLSSVHCPFISTLGAEGCAGGLEAGNDGYASEPQQEPCPYACVISLGDDSETDTEGDSESCSAREQECERIISLSRNDFQSLLKMHKLTPEQLDCIHDIRRRSKNRIAAQRCRKRKLDCIQNLESEIEKLQNEKESLLKERDHILSTLGETKQNLTGLCQQVCKEAALSQEQIQILAKYSASDCPLSFLLSEKGKSATEGELTLPSIFNLAHVSSVLPSSGRGSGAASCERGVCQAPPSSVDPREQQLGEQGRQSGAISEFCQQMTDKCTTDE
ncbi:transcription regulator protein BACH1 isoform X2 [Dipodomys merriami]|uniref:transcription regulator protein BACH1 isoform X2 n=1 Tax=Dipodomys merriami TaxID=94247 RepID=UPI003855B75A